jgi:hypothetical protein
MTFDNIASGSWFPNTKVIPATLTVPSIGFRHSLSRNSSMKQQGEITDYCIGRQLLTWRKGFTADVSCDFRNLGSDTTPSLIIKPDNMSSDTPIQYNISSNCTIPDASRFPSIAPSCERSRFCSNPLLDIYSIAVNFVTTYAAVSEHGGAATGYLTMLVCRGSTEPYSTSRLRIFIWAYLMLEKRLSWSGGACTPGWTLWCAALLLKLPPPRWITRMASLTLSTQHHFPVGSQMSGELLVCLRSR